MTDGSGSLGERRTSFRSSTESLLLPPRATSHDDHLHEEPSLWHSAPLLFAIAPAVGGVAFKSGSVLLTDIALLALAAVYLNWCLVTPWIWYHSAQTIALAKPPMEGTVSEDALREDLETTDEHEGQDVAPHAGEYPHMSASVNAPNDPSRSHPAAGMTDASANTREASAELAMHELAALAMCVLGPLLGSYILHVIRASLLSLHGGQLVSNMHLTLFVLGAELRPVRHCIELLQARTLHLQRVVRSDPHQSLESASPNTGSMTQIHQRLFDLEASIISSADHQHAENTSKIEPAASPEDVKRTQQALQTQIDAVTRAVRRYEKRETARMVQNEERLSEIEARLREALSLAAAAARYSQSPGFIMRTLEWVTSWVRWAFDLATWPLTWVSNLGWSILKKLGLARPIRRRRPIKRPSESSREGKEKDRYSKKREDGVSRPSDAWLKSRR